MAVVGILCYYSTSHHQKGYLQHLSARAMLFLKCGLLSKRMAVGIAVRCDRKGLFTAPCFILHQNRTVGSPLNRQ
jgi:hypothetical protein